MAEKAMFWVSVLTISYLAKTLLTLAISFVGGVACLMLYIRTTLKDMGECFGKEGENDKDLEGPAPGEWQHSETHPTPEGDY